MSLDIQGKDAEYWKVLENNFSDAKANLKFLDDDKGISGNSIMKKQAFLNKAQERSSFALEGKYAVGVYNFCLLK
jgi:hypothetical protein